MKQQLGLMYSLDNPTSYIISNHLVRYQQHFGGTALLTSLLKAKKRKPKNILDIHINNLCETFGDKAVIEVYNMIYGTKERKIA